MSDRPDFSAADLADHWLSEVQRFQSEIDMDLYEPFNWHLDDWVGMLHIRNRLVEALGDDEPGSTADQGDDLFLSMTEPDERGLVIKHGMRDTDPGWPEAPDDYWWWRRVPRDGEPRRDLEHREAGTGDGLVRFHLVGKHMRTLDGVFEEFARAFSFPDYFGRNFDALDECLTDLDWLPPMDTYAVYIVGSEHVLADEPERLATLKSVLDDAATEWATPVTEGEWRRNARRFKVWWLQ